MMENGGSPKTALTIAEAGVRDDELGPVELGCERAQPACERRGLALDVPALDDDRDHDAALRRAPTMTSR
jgi:hypothetical protein